MRRDSGIGMKGLDRNDGYRPTTIFDRRMVVHHGSDRKSVAYRVRRHAKPIGIFLMIVAVAVIVSAVAVPLTATNGPDSVPADTTQGPPPPPYNVFGYVTDAGGNPVVSVLVTVTDNNTGAEWTNVTDDTYGYYMVDLNTQVGNWSDGDIIYVYASDGAFEGSNESAVDAGAAYLWLDIELTTVIPEFPVLMVPVLGMVAIAAVVSLRRRRGEL